MARRNSIGVVATSYRGGGSVAGEELVKSAMAACHHRATPPLRTAYYHLLRLPTCLPRGMA